MWASKPRLCQFVKCNLLNSDKAGLVRNVNDFMTLEGTVASENYSTSYCAHFFTDLKFFPSGICCLGCDLVWLSVDAHRNPFNVTTYWKPINLNIHRNPFTMITQWNPFNVTTVRNPWLLQLAHGADPTMKNQEGQTPLDLSTVRLDYLLMLRFEAEPSDVSHAQDYKLSTRWWYFTTVCCYVCDGSKHSHWMDPMFNALCHHKVAYLFKSPTGIAGFVAIKVQ